MNNLGREPQNLENIVLLLCAERSQLELFCMVRTSQFVHAMMIAIAADRSARPALPTTWEAPEEPEPPEEPPTSLDGLAVATAFNPPVTAPWSDSVVSELPIALAADWNASNVFPEDGALILPTIPRPQCVTCLQWNQMGSVLVMLIVNAEAVTRPESKPATELELLELAAKYVHGAANEDWVTEWARVPGNQKVTSVPTGAVILAGWNTKVPWKPTSTFICPDVSAGAEGTDGAADVVGELLLGGAP